MRFNFSPIRADKNLTITKQGDLLTINGEQYDFSVIPEGGLLPRDAVDCDLLASDVERIDGEIVLTLLFPIGANATEAQRFPEPNIVTDDGEVSLP